MSKDFAIDLRRVQQSMVAGNTVRNATKGIALVRDLRGNEVRDNSVEASEIAYSIEDSLGITKRPIIESSADQRRLGRLRG
jgi:parallel beta-helix repeat protein